MALSSESVPPAPVPAKPPIRVAWLREIWEAFLDLIFPVKCAVCDRIGQGYLCPECRRRVTPVPPPYCVICQMPGVEGTCRDCFYERPRYGRARAAGTYEGVLRRAILRLKYGRRRAVSGPLSEMLLALAGGDPEMGLAEAIVPVPIHPSRERQRGYNQSALLCVELGRRWERPVILACLVRTRPTRPQVGLHRDERLENIKGAFAVRHPERIAGLRLLLVDDVMTTGATANEAAQALLAAGARRVDVAVLAREGRSVKPPAV